jgi:hypothetical protein
MKTCALFLLIFCGSSLLLLAETPTADQMLAAAESRASAEQKTIFVHFGASWCHWCNRLDAFLDRADIKPVFEKYFIPVKLVVQENEKNKSLENPGADKLLEKFGGPDGIPYSAFLDAHGALIVNSRCPSANAGPGGNIGYPGAPAEVDWFIQMMRKAAPKMSEADLKTIETALRSAKN